MRSATGPVSAAKRIRTLLARVRRVPVRLLPAEAAHRARRSAALAGWWLRDSFVSTFVRDEPAAPELKAFVPRLDPRQVNDQAPDLPDRCARYLEQRFDLLGSGWRTVIHQTACPGFEGHRYEASPVRPDPAGTWLEGQVSRPNLAAARAAWQLIGPGYRPIDWHLDFRSGYRWSPLTWYRAIPYGHLPGVDVKVPWELARMQHLPQLALAFGCARAGLPGFLPAGRYRDAFRNQILDFTATNPPRYGVNWHTTMEVATRVANWFLAYDLFRTYGVEWDHDFEAVFARSVLEHGRHIAANPERSPAWRNNHYLANLVGLAFAGAYLAPKPEAERWRRTAAAGLAAEIRHQFLPDGAHFEGSTGYHAFAVELAAYGLAMVRAGRRDDHGLTAEGEPDELGGALLRMGEFLMHLTRPDGRLVQIGDHDSGRLFKLLPRPAIRPTPKSDAASRRPLDEEHLDARPAVAALGGLLGRADLTRWCGGRRLEELLVAGLAGESPQGRSAGPASRRVPIAAAKTSHFEALRQRLREAPAVESSRLTLAAPGASLRTGIRAWSYPDFGVCVFRSDRLFLALRAGFGRHDRRGAHAHVDQLGLEVAIDGLGWIRDPGSFVFTASPRLRDMYRSSAAHFVPYLLEREALLWRHGPFHLDLHVRVSAAAIGPDGAAVELLLEGTRIAQSLIISEQEIVVDTRLLDRPERARLGIRLNPRYGGRFQFPEAVPTGTVAFSPGYGLRDGEGKPGDGQPRRPARALRSG